MISYKQQIIRDKLADYASDVIDGIKTCHADVSEYNSDILRDKLCDWVKGDIPAWKDLTREIANCEYELSYTRRTIDQIDGEPCGRYSDLCERLSDLQENSEDWLNTFDEVFDNFWDGLYAFLYPEEA